MKLTLVVILALSLATIADAAAPRAPEGSNPGFYRFKVGDFEVNTISDGTYVRDVSEFHAKITSRELDTALKKNFLTREIETSLDAFLINTGEKLILVDTGIGPGIIPSCGHLIEHMVAAGYKPEQVDVVLITHMHADHIGGLVDASGKAAFPNATVYMDKADLDFFLNSKNGEKVQGLRKKSFEIAPVAVEAYRKTGKLVSMTGDTEIVPGIKSHVAYGHSAGHQIYVIESNGQKLLIIGDIIHVGAVEFERPTAAVGFDDDPVNAEKVRIATLNEVAQEGDMIAAAHLPFPGVGHVRAEKKGFVFVPLNYNR